MVANPLTCRAPLIAHSHLDWDISRIGLIGGRIVIYWGVYDLQMRIGTARVRTAGINLPITYPGQRYWHDDSAGDSEQRLRILGRLARCHECEILFPPQYPQMLPAARICDSTHKPLTPSIHYDTM